MKSLKSTFAIIAVGLTMSTASINAQARINWGKVAAYSAGAAVVGAVGYTAYKASKPTQPKQIYCNANDRQMHIFHDTDRVFVDASGKPVPCRPNAQQ